MDSPDKEPVINPGKFSYEYVTKIDGDDWSLGAASDTKVMLLFSTKVSGLFELTEAPESSRKS